MEPAPRIGVSSCLLGFSVRYDGGHRCSGRVLDQLGRAFRLVAECPEAAMGLGVPRPKIHLEAAPDGVRLLGSRGEDLTAAAVRQAIGAAERFRAQRIAGLLLKSRSPSCGPGDARVFRGGVELEATEHGVFSRTVSAALPEIPLIDEIALEDPARWDDWLTRVFALVEIRGLAARGRMSALYRFHARWKMALMAHSETAARRLGRLLATASDPAEALAGYRRGFLAAIAEPSAPNTHQNVLEHLAGHLKHRLDESSRAALNEEICAAVSGSAPLALPIRSLASHARRLGVASLQDQAYLDPRHPALRYRQGACAPR